MSPEKNQTLSPKTPKLKKKSPIKNAFAPAKAALRLNENKFKFMFDHCNLAKPFALPSDEMIMNQVFCDKLGYSLAALQNKKWHEITHLNGLLVQSGLPQNTSFPHQSYYDCSS
jgi:hypothetical protein